MLTVIPAFAQEQAEVVVARSEEPSALLAGDAGAGAFAGEGMTTLHGLVLAEDETWRLLIEARLRLRTFDRDPDDPTVRQEDWDEPSDVAHVLRELSMKTGAFSVRAGELYESTLGHGTLVRAYNNSLDPDHLRAGVRIDVRDTDADVELMVDNYLLPRLIGGRAAARPIDDRFTMGGTAAFDLSAPDRVREDVNGNRSVSTTRNLETDGGVLAMAGGDVEYLFGERERSWLAPYVDANVLLGLGMGLHTGAHASLPAGRLRLRVQGEYRLGTDGYIPAYADALYDIERLQFSLARPGRDPLPKRAAAEAGGFGGQGFLTEIGLGNGAFDLLAGFQRRPGLEGNLLSLRVLAPLGRRTRISLNGQHRGIGQTGRDGLLAAGGLRIRLTDHIYGVGEYARLFELADDGIYRHIQVATIGLGLSQPL